MERVGVAAVRIVEARHDSERRWHDDAGSTVETLFRAAFRAAVAGSELESAEEPDRRANTSPGSVVFQQSEVRVFVSGMR